MFGKKYTYEPKKVLGTIIENIEKMVISEEHYYVRGMLDLAFLCDLIHHDDYSKFKDIAYDKMMKIAEKEKAERIAKAKAKEEYLKAQKEKRKANKGS